MIGEMTNQERESQVLRGRYFHDYDDALRWSRTKNRININKKIFVVVDAEEEGYYVMGIKDAIENDFNYSW